MQEIISGIITPAFPQSFLLAGGSVPATFSYFLVLIFGALKIFRKENSIKEYALDVAKMLLLVVLAWIPFYVFSTGYCYHVYEVRNQPTPTPVIKYVKQAAQTIQSNPIIIHNGASMSIEELDKRKEIRKSVQSLINGGQGILLKFLNKSADENTCIDEYKKWYGSVIGYLLETPDLGISKIEEFKSIFPDKNLMSQEGLRDGLVYDYNNLTKRLIWLGNLKDKFN